MLYFSLSESTENWTEEEKWEEGGGGGGERGEGKERPQEEQRIEGETNILNIS